MTSEEQRAWLEEVRPQLEVIILNAKLLGHVRSKGSGYAADALDSASRGDYDFANSLYQSAISRWNHFIKFGL